MTIGICYIMEYTERENIL